VTKLTDLTIAEARNGTRRASLLMAMLIALAAGPVSAQDFLEGFSGDPLDLLQSGNPYDVLPEGVFATEDGCGNLSRFFGILEERAPDFLVYSPSGVSGENFKCLFQDDAKHVATMDDSREWTVTGQCEGWSLGPSGSANFTIKQLSDDELQITRKLEDIFYVEDFGTFARCPKAG
jgi:hypothetical protein